MAQTFARNNWTSHWATFELMWCTLVILQLFQVVGTGRLVICGKKQDTLFYQTKMPVKFK